MKKLKDWFWKHRWGWLAVGLSVLIYSQSISYALVWDDGYFFDWPKFESVSYVGDWFTGDSPVSQGNVYRPLRSVWWFLGLALWGKNVMLFQVAGLVIYGVAVWFVYCLFEEILKDRFWAGLAAWLWGWYPLHVESVVWVTGSLELVGMIGTVGALWSYLQWKKLPLARYVWMTVGGMLVGFLTYELLLAGVLLISIWDVGVSKKWSEVWRGLWWVWTSVGVYVLVRLWLHTSASDWMYLYSSWPENIGLIGYLAGRFLWNMWLTGQQTINYVLVGGLSSFVNFDGTELAMGSLWTVETGIMYGLLVAWLGGMIWCWYRWRLLGIMMAWVLVGLVPAVYVIPISVLAADRYTVLASVGWVGILAVIAERAYGEYRNFSVGVVTMILCIWGFQVWQYTPQWRSSVSLWDHAARYNQTSWYVWRNLAGSYVGQGDLEGAMLALETAVQLRPTDVDGWLRLRYLYLETGNLEGAEVIRQQLEEHDVAVD